MAPDQAQQQYCLRWNSHQRTLVSVLESLLASESLVDVTLYAEGLPVRAHKVVLSACSQYFRKVLSAHDGHHPVIILKDVSHKQLVALVDYMYRGQVNVAHDQLPALIKTAESLSISGLADGNDEEHEDEDCSISEPHTSGGDVEESTMFSRRHTSIQDMDASPDSSNIKPVTQKRMPTVTKPLTVPTSEDNNLPVLAPSAIQSVLANVASSTQNGAADSSSRQSTEKVSSRGCSIDSAGSDGALSAGTSRMESDAQRSGIMADLLDRIPATITPVNGGSMCKKSIGTATASSMYSVKQEDISGSERLDSVTEGDGLEGNGSVDEWNGTGTHEILPLPVSVQQDLPGLQSPATHGYMKWSALDMADSPFGSMDGGAGGQGGVCAPPADMLDMFRPRHAIAAAAAAAMAGGHGLPASLSQSLPGGPMAFTCERCGRVYATSSSLNRHRRYECGQPPQFACPICQVKFKHKHNMRTHVRIHHNS